MQAAGKESRAMVKLSASQGSNLASQGLEETSWSVNDIIASVCSVMAFWQWLRRGLSLKNASSAGSMFGQIALS